ncbi:MAG: hypothetical protein KDD40_00930 [Bdellovibrionales bacterium]|nr:hypothetical protein [Bdellovibrionales bacterium]
MKTLIVSFILLATFSAQAFFVEDGEFVLFSGPKFKSYEEINNYNLESAIEEAKEKLFERRQNLFFKYFERLLEIAAQDPGLHNLQPLLAFIDWASRESLISQARTQMIRYEYFHYEFISYQESMLSEACDQVDDLLSQLKIELSKKQMGLKKALGQEDKYIMAENVNYWQLVQLLEDYCR